MADHKIYLSEEIRTDGPPVITYRLGTPTGVTLARGANVTLWDALKSIPGISDNDTLQAYWKARPDTMIWEAGTKVGQFRPRKAKVKKNG